MKYSRSMFWFGEGDGGDDIFVRYVLISWKSGRCRISQFFFYNILIV